MKKLTMFLLLFAQTAGIRAMTEYEIEYLTYKYRKLIFRSRVALTQVPEPNHKKEQPKEIKEDIETFKEKIKTLDSKLSNVKQGDLLDI